MTNVLTKFRNAVAIVALCLVCAVSLVAQGPSSLPPTWVFARAYNGWNIIGQQTNTYTFNGGVCNYAPYNNGATASFFVFSGFQGSTTVYFPVFIQDANPALNEIVTPTSTTQGSGSCGFAASTANSHTSFNLTSGTAGLQEAIATQFQTTPVFDVILDKNWYQTVAGFPVTTTPQSIIGSVTGNANVGIVDVTTTPWTYYSWNGSKYVVNAGASGVSFSSVTAVAAPTALSTAAATSGLITTATTGGTLPASATYRFGATCVTPIGGETTISIDSASTATIATGSGTATNTITVTSPAGCTAANGAVGWRLYMSAASGASLSEILYAPTCTASTGQFVLNGVCAIGSSATVTAVITGTAKIPTVNSAFLTPGSNTSPVPLVSYPPFTALGTVATTVVGNLGVVNLPAGFLNTLGRTVRMCGTGYGTTNGTGGTLTFTTLLASIPGVTSVTPFSVVSPSIAASVIAVNFTFCETWTTQATGTTGTVEAHGTVDYNVAGTAVTSPAQDNVILVSSTVDLTKQDQLEFNITPTTAGLTIGQLRQLTVEVLQ